MNDIDRLLEELILEKQLTTKERDNMDTSAFGIPELRKYPLNDKEHVIKAKQFFKDCPDKYKSQLRANINKAAKKFGVDKMENYNIDDEIDKLLEDLLYETDNYEEPKWTKGVQKVSSNTIKVMSKSKTIRKFGETDYAKNKANRNVNNSVANRREHVKAKVKAGKKLKPWEQKLWDDMNKGKKLKEDSEEIIQEGMFRKQDINNSRDIQTVIDKVTKILVGISNQYQKVYKGSNGAGCASDITKLTYAVNKNGQRTALEKLNEYCWNKSMVDRVADKVKSSCRNMKVKIRVVGYLSEDKNFVKCINVFVSSSDKFDIKTDIQ